MEQIIQDYTMTGRMRLTHKPSEETIVYQPCMTDLEWVHKVEAFKQKFPGVKIVRD